MEAGLLAAAVFLPPLQRVFSTGPPPAAVWPLLVLGPLALLAVDEVVKAIGRRRVITRVTARSSG